MCYAAARGTPHLQRSIPTHEKNACIKFVIKVHRHHNRSFGLPANERCVQLPIATPYSWLDQDSVLPRNWFQDAASQTPTTDARSRGIHLFRIPTYLSDPVGLDLEDPSAGDSSAASDPGPDWLQFAMGNDNPFFDLRHRGDPGGVGYYKVSSQVQLFDAKKTGCALGFQGVTPAGPEQVGNFDGPTVFRPSVTLFHELDDGTAVQGFLGRQLRVDSFSGARINQGVEYGLTLHRPLATDDLQGFKNVFVFVEALGRYRYEAGTGVAAPLYGGAPNTFEFVPGLHFKMNDNWWVSGGVVLPLNQSTNELRLWQLTCSFQF